VNILDSRIPEFKCNEKYDVKLEGWKTGKKKETETGVV